jgi:signal transduction histidine kinase
VPEVPVKEAVQRGSQGIGAGVTAEQVPIRFAFSRSAETGWTATIALESTQYNRQRAYSLWIGLALASVGIAIALLFAVLLAERMRRSVIALSRVAQGGEPQHHPLRIREFEEVERALVRAAATAQNEARERENRRVAEVQREEAAAANRDKDRFIAMLSHELRNPLSALRNAVHAMGRAGAAQDTLDIMRRQIAHLSRLVEDLLDLSRITLGKLQLDKAVFDLRTSVRNAIESTALARESKNQTLVQRVPETEVRLHGDSARLTQVFANLLDNASKFSSREAMIEMELRVSPPYALVTVTDNGAGIDASLLESIFMPFTQGPATGVNAGLGIGLGLAKSLVEQHGGTIAAHSAGAGRGSSFIVRLQLEIERAEP